MFAHRCFICAVRNVVVGDRPMHVTERLHRKLFIRAQHVVCADRDKSKGQLSSVMLTHSAVSDCDDVEEKSRYATFIEHCVRAELMSPGGHFEYVKQANPSSSGGRKPKNILFKRPS